MVSNCQDQFTLKVFLLDAAECNIAKRENTVTCCKKCNSKKGSTMPNQLHSIGMKLRREPRCPSKYELAAEAGKMVPRRVHPTWKPFLGIDEDDTEREEGHVSLQDDSRNYFDLS